MTASGSITVFTRGCKRESCSGRESGRGADSPGNRGADGVELSVDLCYNTIIRNLQNGLRIVVFIGSVSMRFERIDDKTVKCFLSMDEVEAYDITYKDFLTRSEKAREVIEDIFEQAGQAVGYKPPEFAMDLQIMVVPNQGMVLTFSEKGPEDLPMGKEFMDCLKEVKNILDSKDKDTIANLLESGLAKAIDNWSEKKEQLEKGNAGGAQSGGDSSKELQTKAQSEEKQSGFAVFEFESIRDICEYAKCLPANLRVKSALYELNGRYYLYLEKGGASYERYSRACIRAMEYAALYTAEQIKVDYLKEYGSCLIPERAVKQLMF